MKSHGLYMPEEWIEHTDQLAEEHNTTRAAVLRALIDTGWRAVQNGDYELDPEEFHRPNAPELSQQGKNPRWATKTD